MKDAVIAPLTKNWPATATSARRSRVLSCERSTAAEANKHSVDDRPASGSHRVRSVGKATSERPPPRPYRRAAVMRIWRRGKLFYGDRVDTGGSLPEQQGPGPGGAVPWPEVNADDLPLTWA